MVQVSDKDAIAELMQAAQQAETIGAAGHAQHDTLARGKELFAADEFRNSRSGIHGRGIIASRSAVHDRRRVFPGSRRHAWYTAVLAPHRPLRTTSWP